MPQNHNRLVTTGAQAIRETFGSYRKRFDEVTLRARSRFETLDWQGIRADAAERLDLYKNEVDKIERSIRDLLQDRCEDKRIWANLKGSFAALVKARNDRELAETFFNSVTRRIFATIGIDPQIEFVETDIENLPGRAETKIYRRYRGGTSATALIGNILADCLLSDGFRNLENDARQVAAKIETRLHEIGCPAAIDYIDMAESIFYRGMGAYLVGRIC